MNNSALDEHIKNQLGNYKPDVPAHIWENIAAEKDRRKPVGFWFNTVNRNVVFLLLGIILLGGAIIAYKNIYSTAANDKADSKSELKTADKKTTDLSSENNLVKNTETNNNINIVPVSKEGQIKNITATGNDQKEIKNIVDKKLNAKTTKSTQSKNKKQRLAINISGNTSSNETESLADVSKNKKGFKGKSRVALTASTATVDDNEEVNTIPPESLNTNNDLLLNRLLLNLDLLRTENNITANVKKPTVPYLNIPCPESEKNAAGNKRYFEIYAGPDYAFRSITDTGNSAYLQKRKESTSFSSAFSVGVRYTKVFNNSMSFRTGINYSQINEKFKFAEGNIIQVVYIVDGNGDTTGSYTTSGTRYKTTYNKFRTIDVPLLIGYEVGNGRLHVNFNAGAIVNIYSWQKGDVLDTTYNPITITTGKNASPYQFKTNVGIGFLGSVSVYYKLTNRLHLLAEPYFRYNFVPASKADLTIKQKYNTAGLRLGVRIDF